MKRLNRVLSILCVLGLFLFLGGMAVQGAETAKVKALIVDGQNNHNWAGTTPVLKDILEKSERFTVDVATTPTENEKKENKEQYDAKMKAFKPDFSKYDVVVMNYNGDAWPKETNDAFEKFVADGGGLVVFHAANNSFTWWKEYNEMIAIGGWGGRNEKHGPYLYMDDDGREIRDRAPGHGGSHGPQWEFLLEVREPEHPIMKGMPLKFRHCKDELYDRLRGPAKNVTILATAYAPKDKGGTDRHEPQLMVIDYKEGRIFHICLGHDAGQCKSVSFIVPFLRGTEWAATGEVTIPVPDDMPGEDKPVMRE